MVFSSHISKSQSYISSREAMVWFIAKSSFSTSPELFSSCQMEILGCSFCLPFLQDNIFDRYIASSLKEVVLNILLSPFDIFKETGQKEIWNRRELKGRCFSPPFKCDPYELLCLCVSVWQLKTKGKPHSGIHPEDVNDLNCGGIGIWQGCRSWQHCLHI